MGIVDVFDALTTTRSYRGAMPAEKAVAEITRCKNSWSPAVYEAFMQAVAQPAMAAETGQDLAAQQNERSETGNEGSGEGELQAPSPLVVIHFTDS